MLCNALCIFPFFFVVINVAVIKYCHHLCLNVLTKKRINYTNTSENTSIALLNNKNMLKVFFLSLSLSLSVEGWRGHHLLGVVTSHSFILNKREERRVYIKCVMVYSYHEYAFLPISLYLSTFIYIYYVNLLV